MLNQCWWIVVSYITRRLFLFSAAFWVVFQVLVLVTNWNTPSPILTQGPTIYSEQYRLPVRNTDDLKRVRAEGKQNDVDFLEMSMVTREPPFAEPSVNDGRPTRISRLDKFPNYIATIAKEFPNVRGLSGVLLFNAGNFQNNEKVVSDLAQFKRLEFLNLTGSIDSPTDLNPLQNVPNLRMLDIQWLEIRNLNKPFPTLTNLETLTLGSRVHVNDMVLASIATLPRLTTLSFFGGFGSNPEQSITPKGLTELRQSNSLRLIYVGATNSDGSPIKLNFRPSPPLPIDAPPADWWQTNLIDTVVRAVGPGISIRNAYRFPTASLVPFFMGALFIGLIVGVQLAAARSSILSWMAPRHKRLPLWIAACSIMAFSTISSVLAANVEFPLSRTFPLASLTTLAGSTMGFITLCSFLPNIIRVGPVLLGSSIFFGCSFLPSHFWDQIGYFDYLRGHNPQGTLVVLALMTALAVIVMAVYLPRYEYIAPLNTFRALATGESVKMPHSMAQNSSRGIQKWLLGTYDQRLEKALNSHRLKSIQGQVKRWRVGIPLGGWGWWYMMITTTLAFTSISYLLPAPIAASVRFGGIAPITVMAPIIIGFAWRQRRKVFSVELLRPKARAHFQREIRSAFLLDLIPAFTWGIIVLLYIALSGSTQFSMSDLLRIEAILFPAVLLALTALSATIVLVRGVWIMGALYFVLCMTFGLSMATLQFMIGSTTTLIIVSATVSLLSLAGLAWLASYWKRMEIGR